MACKYYRESLKSLPVCYGTKNAEQCRCEGNAAKCDFYEHIRKETIANCTDVLSAAIICSGERQKSSEQATTGSAVSVETGSKTILPTEQKERTPMKDKRFVLNLHLEQNEELMAEIDNLIRERVKTIIREEAEKMIGGTVHEEARSVIKAKLESMPKYKLENAISTGVRSFIIWSDKLEEIVKNQIHDYMDDHEYATNRVVADCVNHKLSQVANADVIKAVLDVFVNK